MATGQCLHKHGETMEWRPVQMPSNANPHFYRKKPEAIIIAKIPG